MKKEHKIKGLQDPALELRGDEVDTIAERTTLFRHDHMHMENGRLVEDTPPIVERTPLAQQELISIMHRVDTAYTREEIKKVREALKHPNQPKHHPKTPLPLPPQ